MFGDVLGCFLGCFGNGLEMFWDVWGMKRKAISVSPDLSTVALLVGRQRTSSDRLVIHLEKVGHLLSSWWLALLLCSMESALGFWEKNWKGIPYLGTRQLDGSFWGHSVRGPETQLGAWTRGGSPSKGKPARSTQVAPI